jgi:hypothetical protein
MPDMNLKGDAAERTVAAIWDAIEMLKKGHPEYRVTVTALPFGKPEPHIWIQAWTEDGDKAGHHIVAFKKPIR